MSVRVFLDAWFKTCNRYIVFIFQYVIWNYIEYHLLGQFPVFNMLIIFDLNNDKNTFIGMFYN